MNIEIVYGDAINQTLLSLAVEIGTTVGQALQQANLPIEYEQAGIFGQVVSLDKVVEANDRIELYRSLVISPMQARRLRAKKAVVRKQRRSSPLPLAGEG